LPLPYAAIFMPLSHFLTIYPLTSQEDFLLFSTRRSSKVLLTDKALQAARADTLPAKEQSRLEKLGIMVPGGVEERRELLTYFDLLNFRSTVTAITMLLNLDCNFSCPYCYEEKVRGNLYMTEETAREATRFIKTRFDQKHDTLLVDFYGGEPLLSLNLIKSISRELKSFTASRGASYRFTLVTNGSLFTRRVAEELKELGLESVKITLDGPAETHNQSRPFKSGKGSFDTLIRNIKDTCDIVKVGIGGNFERTTYRRFSLLLEYLMSEGLTPERLASIKFDPIMEIAESPRGLADHKAGCLSSNEPWLVEAGTWLREEVLRRGYHTPKVQPIFCMVENRDSFVVNYDGSLYKCPGFIGNEAYAIGNVESGIKEYSATYQLDIWKNEECLECVYLPLCFGGCRYMTYLQDGNIKRVDCRKAYFDACLETLVKQDIAYLLPKKQEQPPNLS
jgi:uncharacterized protein